LGGLYYFSVMSKDVMTKSAIYIMCGLPFSGKTTLARTLADQCGFIHLDLDVIAREKRLFPEEGINDEQWAQVFREVYRQVAILLASGKSVVFDAVNYDRVGRDRLRTIAQQSDSVVHVIYVDLPIQEIKQRRQSNQANRQRPPVRDQDFMDLATEFEIPMVEENLLVYDGIQSIVGICAFSSLLRGLKWVPTKWRCLIPPTSG
jgi:predicted kinase